MWYPLFFLPIHKERIWGGQALTEKYHRVLPDAKIGESWEIACHGDDCNMISNGPLQGMKLQEAINIYKEAILGSDVLSKDSDKFPLLIKILDACDALSVQVHPDDIYANTHEDGELGKTEMWYVIDAQPNAELTYGLKLGTTRDQFAIGAQNGCLEHYLQTVKVTAGDVLFIPSGMLHAIGAGILICEIQQNSDTTYRVFDWNRLDDRGNARELHLDKALDVIDFDGKYTHSKLEGLTIEVPGGKRTIFVACQYFAMEKLCIDGTMKIEMDGLRFYTLTCIDGCGMIEYDGKSEKISAGTSCLIPAAMSGYSIQGKCTIIKAFVPDRKKNYIEPLTDMGYNPQQLSVIPGLFD